MSMKLTCRKTIACLGGVLVVLGIVWPASAQMSTYSATTDTHDSTWNTSTRVKQTRVEAEGRTIETQVVEEPSINGGYALVTEIEKETVQVRPGTIRVVERLYARDQDGRRQLSRVSEVETTTVPGRSKTLRTNYESDVNGHLQAMERETEESIPLNASTDQIVSTTFRLSGGTYVPIHRTVKVETRKKDGVTDGNAVSASSNPNENPSR